MERCCLSSLDCYLGDDLAVLSVDLRDATPLCQEGEDLIELQEEDSETEKSSLCQNTHTRSLRSFPFPLSAPQLACLTTTGP